VTLVHSDAACNHHTEAFKSFAAEVALQEGPRGGPALVLTLPKRGKLALPLRPPLALYAQRLAAGHLGLRLPECRPAAGGVNSLQVTLSVGADDAPELARFRAALGAALAGGRRPLAARSLAAQPGAEAAVLAAALGGRAAAAAAPDPASLEELPAPSAEQAAALALARRGRSVSLARRRPPLWRRRDRPCGNLHQLPPVAPRGAPRRFAFEAAAWCALAPEAVELTTVFRQRDAEFVELAAVRAGEAAPGGADAVPVAAALRAAAEPFPDDGVLPTRPLTHRGDVDAENEAALAALPGAEVRFGLRTRARGRLPCACGAHTQGRRPGRTRQERIGQARPRQRRAQRRRALHLGRPPGRPLRRLWDFRSRGVRALGGACRRRRDGRTAAGAAEARLGGDGAHEPGGDARSGRSCPRPRL
jgi:hypothetical protein